MPSGRRLATPAGSLHNSPDRKPGRKRNYFSMDFLNIRSIFLSVSMVR